VEAIGMIIIAAVLAEATWETGKMVWVQGRVSVDRVGALIVGLLFAVGAGLDICALLGLAFIHPLIGQVLTGILLSRGANFVHDLFKLAEGLAAK
jgi:hypothetical protein